MEFDRARVIASLLGDLCFLLSAIFGIFSALNGSPAAICYSYPAVGAVVAIICKFFFINGKNY